ncbi:transcription termination factor NusA [candidate division WOR-3 bacterium]|nr:transcription termination factor NusA [candidate division WOR-3 bacterium]MCK4527063.1 transcription termination factor NusA [candidate division WOR-3 bacterium]
MIDRGIVSILSELSTERELKKDFILETLKESIIAAAKKQFGNLDNLKCEISEASGVITLYKEKKVIEKVEDPINEISLDEARKIKPTIEIGTIFKEEIPIEEFGRNAITVIKNTLIQKIKTNEKEILYEKYRKKIGELVSGTVARLYSTGAYIKVGDVEAFLAREEQIPEKRLRKGAPIKAIIKEVTKHPKEGDEERVRIKGPVIYLTRIDQNFVIRLLEFEIPEILHSEVEIKGIVRVPGKRTKIAVYSNNEKIDAVGSCVGHRGNRIQSIVRELAGERVDIIRWKTDKAQYAAEALSPVEVVGTELLGEKKVLCIVPDDEITGAIGKIGENVTLAAQLTELEIEIKGRTDYHKEKEVGKRKMIKVKNLLLSAHKKKLLKDAGIKNVQDIVSLNREELLKIKGMGNKTVDEIFTAIHKAMNQEHGNI